MYFLVLMLLQHVFVCCTWKRARISYICRHSSSCPVCSIRHTERVPMELLFNFRNVHSLFGMKRMLLDSLKWILFHTPLNSKQHLYTGLQDAILWVNACSLKCVCVCVHACVCGGVAVGGWGSDCDLEMPIAPVRTSLSSPDQSNTVTLAPSWDPWDLLEVPVTAWRAVVKSQLCSPALLRRVLKALCTWPT